MAESTLTVDKHKIDSEVGHFLGYGYGSRYDDTAWTADQIRDIDRRRQSGLRQFYFPVIDGVQYSWSFLKPVATLTLLDDADAVDLPDDFAALEGPVIVEEDSNGYEVRVKGDVRHLHSLYQDETGRPQCVAIEPVKGTLPDRGQRFRLHVFPTADQNYTLRLRYQIAPGDLTEERPFPYGGVAHGETILQACLKAAENEHDDASGLHAMEFDRRLAASITHDRNLTAQLHGYNGDRSNAIHHGHPRRFREDPVITFNGTVWD